ncbi:MAG: hypothetical protein AB1405_12945 [Bdellovibrionota bacterium]
MTQVPQISQISRKNDDRLDHLPWRPDRLDALGQQRNFPEKMMIALPGKVATKKNMAPLATFVGWVVPMRLKRFSGGPRKEANEKRLAILRAKNDDRLDHLPLAREGDPPVILLEPCLTPRVVLVTIPAAPVGSGPPGNPGTNGTDIHFCFGALRPALRGGFAHGQG